MSVKMMMVSDTRIPVTNHRPLVPFAQFHSGGVPLYNGPMGPPCVQFQRGIPLFSVFGGTVDHPPQETVRNSDHVEVRQVCRYNLKTELALIQSLMRRGYRFASVDTEFPGTVVPPRIEKHLLSQALPVDIYEMMKENVNKTNIIQLGLTLSDPYGYLPVHEGAYCCWEFNFSDFDIDSDTHLRNNDSIELLKREGIDFCENKQTGICSLEFALEIKRSGLVGMLPCLTWVTFQCSYDFGFLIKTLTGQKLPDSIKEFMGMMREYFGPSVYDIKFMMRFCPGLFGGLERVANTLGVGRVAGNCHQAGSDSLLTLQTFIKLLRSEKDKGKEKQNYEKYEKLCDECRGILYGLGSLQYH